MFELERISIINLENTKSSDYIEACSHAFEELEIQNLLNFRPQYINGKMTKFNAIDFFVTDLETIHHRLDIFDDLLEFKGIYHSISDIMPDICSLREFGQRREEPFHFIEYLYSIKEIQLYVDCINKLYHSICVWDKKVKSEGLKKLIFHIKEIYEGQEYQNLVVNLQTLDFRTKIKSITVGINLNLDASHQIIDDIGILSLNEYRIKGGNSIFERIRSKSKLPSQSQGLTHSITPIEPFLDGFDDRVKESLTLSFKTAIDAGLKKTLKKVEFEITNYVKQNTNFLADLLPEFCFLIAGVEFIDKLKEKNMEICKPKLNKKKYNELKGLKNPHLLSTLKSQEIQDNDVTFNEEGMIYVLTGANSGGKSVFLQSVGIAQALFQLGLYIPASEASLSSSDHICVHFPSKVTVEVDGGRFEQECKTVNEILKDVTENSFILMDESFSSTSAYDASILAESMLKYLASKKCKGIFSTHIHDLDKGLQKINRNSPVKVESLVAITDSGNRVYRIERGVSEGHSHAKDIAKKYGLLFDLISE